MFGKRATLDMINRSAETPADRRNFLRAAGVGLAGVGAGAAAISGAGSAAATEHPATGAPSDITVLNFALNLEYLEASFYQKAARDLRLPTSLGQGVGQRGEAVGGRKVTFATPAVRKIIEEIAGDELAHVKFLRNALGDKAVSMPHIDLSTSFTAAAQAAGLIKAGETFDPYANENNFLLAAFIFEDVGVTAYKGAAPLISNKAYLEAAAGILAVEAYHAGTIRTLLFERGLAAAADKISDARDRLTGAPKPDLDQGITGVNDGANITPADKDAIAFSRTPGQTLNVVFLKPGKVDRGGFFPYGINGEARVSG